MADLPRTLAIVRELAQGKHLVLPCGKLGMGEDLSIGFLLDDGHGHQTIAGLSTMDLRELDQLLTRHGIGFPIPSAP